MKQDSSHNQFADEELVKNILGGKKDDFKILVERYQARVRSLAHAILQSKEDSEDVSQEAFVKAYLSLADFRGQSRFYTWLYKIVYHMCIDFKRRFARRGGANFEFNENISQVALHGGKESLGPLDHMFRKEQRKFIQEALSKLSEEHRAAIVLREVDGLSYEELAQITGASRGTIMSRLHYARKNLQKMLGEYVSRDGGIEESQFMESNYSKERKEQKVTPPKNSFSLEKKENNLHRHVVGVT